LRGMPDTKSTPKRAFLLLFIAECPLL